MGGEGRDEEVDTLFCFFLLFFGGLSKSKSKDMFKEEKGRGRGRGEDIRILKSILNSPSPPSTIYPLTYFPLYQANQYEYRIPPPEKKPLCLRMCVREREKFGI